MLRCHKFGLSNNLRSNCRNNYPQTYRGNQKLLNPQHGNTTTPEEEGAWLAVITNNPATEKHFALQIKALQDAPRDPDKLRELLKVKQKDYEKAEDSEHIDRLVTEVEMLKFVLFLVCRNKIEEE